jgi:low affinity Fe/Cu permease
VDRSGDAAVVFFIQHSTARDLRAILIKLDELISSTTTPTTTSSAPSSAA